MATHVTSESGMNEAEFTHLRLSRYMKERFSDLCIGSELLRIAGLAPKDASDYCKDDHDNDDRWHVESHGRAHPTRERRNSHAVV